MKSKQPLFLFSYAESPALSRTNAVRIGVPAARQWSGRLTALYVRTWTQRKNIGRQLLMIPAERLVRMDMNALLELSASSMSLCLPLV